MHDQYNWGVGMKIYCVTWSALVRSSGMGAGAFVTTDYRYNEYRLFFDDKGAAEKKKAELIEMALKLKTDIYTPVVEEVDVSGREAQ